MGMTQQKFPENLIRYDQSKPLIYTDQLGGGYWQVSDSISRNDIPIAKRATGMMISYKVGGSWVTKRYQGSDTLDVNWVNESNWGEVGGIDTTSLSNRIDQKLNIIDTNIFVSSRYYVDSSIANIPIADSSWVTVTADTLIGGNLKLTNISVDATQDTLLNYNPTTKKLSTIPTSTITGSFWDYDGNSFSFPNNKIGCTSNSDLRFIVNNNVALTLDSSTRNAIFYDKIYSTSVSTGSYFDNTGFIVLGGGGKISAKDDLQLIIDNLNNATTGSLTINNNSTSSPNELFRFSENGRFGIGTTSASYNLSFSGTSAKTIGIESATSGKGNSLNLEAGNAQSGGTDLNAGNVNIGSATRSTGTGTNSINFYTNTAGSTGTSYNTPTKKLEIMGDGGIVGTSIKISATTPYGIGVGIETGINDVSIGYQAGKSNTYKGSIFIGSNSGTNANINDASALGGILIGNSAGYNSTGTGGILIGTGAGYNSTGDRNLILGYNAGSNATLSGGFNTIIGSQAGFSMTSGSRNFLAGDRTGYAITSGSDNIFIGAVAGAEITSGSKNIFLGYEAGRSLTTVSNKLYISNSNTDKPLIKGDFSTSQLQFNGTTQSVNGYRFSLEDALTDNTNDTLFSIPLATDSSLAIICPYYAIASDGDTIQAISGYYNINAINLNGTLTSSFTSTGTNLTTTGTLTETLSLSLSSNVLYVIVNYNTSITSGASLKVQYKPDLFTYQNITKL